VSPTEFPTQKLEGALGLVSLLGVAILVLAIGAGLTAIVAILRAAFPGPAASLDEASARRSRMRRFLIGLLNGPALFILAIAFGSKPATKSIGIFFVVLLAAIALLGLCAEVPRIGRSLLRTGGRAGSPLAHTLVGGILLTLAMWVPFAGWIVVAGVLLIGVGSAVSWIFTSGGRRDRRPAA
jgi:hypothetical protein